MSEQLGQLGGRIDGHNQITVWHPSVRRATVVAARDTVGLTARAAALALDLKVGPRDNAVLAVGGVGVDSTRPGSCLSPDESYELAIIGGTV